ncbi:MAG: site-specific DNA-methyltransferase [Chloroflexi bacterium]|nr:site-specific DNA-methyltransferase [Chloroflexota bacterium]
MSFPPHLVRDYIRDFALNENTVLLDPFCGTGTTIVESKLSHIPSIGLEANPFPYFASSVKVDWQIDPLELQNVADEVIIATYRALANEGIDDRSLTSDPNIQLKTLDQQATRALINNSISPLPLHKTLVLLEQIEKHKNLKHINFVF